MAVSGDRAYRLLMHVLAQIEPHLPHGVHVKITPHRWTTLQRADDGAVDAGPLIVLTDDHGLPKSSSGVAVRALGAWIPFLPANLRRRLAAQDAVETVLGLAYEDLNPGAGHAPDMRVRTTTRVDGAVVSYAPPDRPTVRIELEPIPIELL